MVKFVSSPPVASPASEKLMDMVAGFQSSRMNDQRASLPTFPGLNSTEVIGQLVETNKGPDDNFFEMLMRCQVCAAEQDYVYCEIFVVQMSILKTLLDVVSNPIGLLAIALVWDM